MSRGGWRRWIYFFPSMHTMFSFLSSEFTSVTKMLHCRICWPIIEDALQTTYMCWIHMSVRHSSGKRTKLRDAKGGIEPWLFKCVNPSPKASVPRLGLSRHLRSQSIVWIILQRYTTFDLLFFNFAGINKCTSKTIVRYGYGGTILTNPSFSNSSIGE